MSWDGRKRWDTIELINTFSEQSLLLSDSPDVASGFVLESADFGTAAGQTDWSSNVGQLGGDKLNTSLNTRDIEIVGWCYANTKEDMALLKQSVNPLFNPFQDIKAIYKDWFIVFTPNSSIQYSNSYEDNSEVMCRFIIQGVAGIPLWKDLTETSYQTAPAYPVKVFSLVIPQNKGGAIFGLLGEGSNRNIRNNGDVPAGFRLILKTIQEPIDNPRIDVVHQDGRTEFCVFNLSLTINTQLVIDSNYGAESAKLFDNNGVLLQNALMVMSRDSTLFVLQPGDNMLTVSENGVATDQISSEFLFSPMYMEVQQ